MYRYLALRIRALLVPRGCSLIPGSQVKGGDLIPRPRDYLQADRQPVGIETTSPLQTLVDDLQRRDLTLPDALAYFPDVRVGFNHTIWHLLSEYALLSRWCVGENYGARIESLRPDELQGFRVATLVEETFSASHDDREDHQPVFVDEVVLHQGVHEVTATEDQDVFARLIFEP